MANNQKQQIKITDAVCKQNQHKEQSIVALCLNPTCKEISTVCAICLLKGHHHCQAYQYELDEIPQKLMDLRKLQNSVCVLQEQVNQKFQELFSQLEQILLPISKYQDKPDSTNLNEIGKYLRQIPEQKIIERIDVMKSEIKILFGDNIVKVDELQDKEYCKRGEELYQQKEYRQAIKCFDQQIAINYTKNESSFYLKGCSLSKLGLFNQSNSCYEETLKINPENKIAKQCLSENKKIQMQNNH